MLSIIILTFNQKDITLRCLDSLDSYMRKHPDDEIVLVDNGSTDSTTQGVISRQYEWQTRLSIVNLPHNLGVAAGRNRGLLIAKGDILMLLDNDTLPACNAIETLVDYITAHPKVGILAPRLCDSAGHTQDSAKTFPGINVKLANVIGISKPTALPTNQVSHPCYVIGACQLMRRETMEQVGFLDERIFYGPEDADYCLRIKNAGYSIDYLPSVSIIHDYRRLTTRNPFSRLARKHMCGLIYFWIKHRRII